MLKNSEYIIKELSSVFSSVFFEEIVKFNTSLKIERFIENKFIERDCNTFREILEKIYAEMRKSYRN
ncbi:MAG: hypothetical protein QM479_13770, partial [Pseudomonadota bacterium]